MVSVRFSQAEYDAVVAGARELGLTMSQFLRGVALADDAVPAVDFDDIPQYAKDVLYGYSEGFRAGLGERRRLEDPLVSHLVSLREEP
jgi:hypothetical protein